MWILGAILAAMRHAAVTRGHALIATNLRLCMCRQSSKIWRLSNASHRWDVHNVAVVPDGRMVNKKFLRLHAAYTPCGIGLASTRARRF